MKKTIYLVFVICLIPMIALSETYLSEQSFMLTSGSSYEIAEGSDLNDFTTYGNYLSSTTSRTASILHKPDGLTRGFRLEVFDTSIPIHY